MGFTGDVDVRRKANIHPVTGLVGRLGHFVTGNDPQAYARGYNPVREGGDFVRQVPDLPISRVNA